MLLTSPLCVHVNAGPWGNQELMPPAQGCEVLAVAACRAGIEMFALPQHWASNGLSRAQLAEPSALQTPGMCHIFLQCLKMAHLVLHRGLSAGRQLCSWTQVNGQQQVQFVGLSGLEKHSRHLDETLCESMRAGCADLPASLGEQCTYCYVELTQSLQSQSISPVALEQREDAVPITPIVTCTPALLLAPSEPQICAVSLR